MMEEQEEEEEGGMYVEKEEEEVPYLSLSPSSSIETPLGLVDDSDNEELPDIELRYGKRYSTIGFITAAEQAEADLIASGHKRVKDWLDMKYVPFDCLY